MTAVSATWLQDVKATLRQQLYPRFKNLRELINGIGNDELHAFASQARPILEDINSHVSQAAEKTASVREQIETLEQDFETIRGYMVSTPPLLADDDLDRVTDHNIRLVDDSLAELERICGRDILIDVLHERYGTANIERESITPPSPNHVIPLDIVESFEQLLPGWDVLPNPTATDACELLQSLHHSRRQYLGTHNSSQLSTQLSQFHNPSQHMAPHTPYLSRPRIQDRFQHDPFKLPHLQNRDGSGGSVTNPSYGKEPAINDPFIGHGSSSPSTSNDHSSADNLSESEDDTSISNEPPVEDAMEEDTSVEDVAECEDGKVLALEQELSMERTNIRELESKYSESRLHLVKNEFFGMQLNSVDAIEYLQQFSQQRNIVTFPHIRLNSRSSGIPPLADEFLGRETQPSRPLSDGYIYLLDDIFREEMETASFPFFDQHLPWLACNINTVVKHLSNGCIYTLLSLSDKLVQNFHPKGVGMYSMILFVITLSETIPCHDTEALLQRMLFELADGDHSHPFSEWDSLQRIFVALVISRVSSAPNLQDFKLFIILCPI